jgi:bacteriocin-like protein
MTNDVMTNEVHELTDAELETVQGGGSWLFGWFSPSSDPYAQGYSNGGFYKPSTNVAKGLV